MYVFQPFFEHMKLNSYDYNLKRSCGKKTNDICKINTLYSILKF